MANDAVARERLMNGADWTQTLLKKENQLQLTMEHCLRSGG